jgi:hypothetical protein
MTAVHPTAFKQQVAKKRKKKKKEKFAKQKSTHYATLAGGLINRHQLTVKFSLVYHWWISHC